MHILYRFYRLNKEWLAIGAAIVFGLGLGLVTLKMGPRLETWSQQKLLLAIFGFVVGIIMVITRNAPRVLLLSMVFAYPFNLAFAPIDKSIPYHAGGAMAGVILFPYDFPLFALIGLGFLDIVFQRKPIHFSIIDVVALFYIFWAIVSFFNTQHLMLSLFEVIRMIKLYLLFRVVASVTNTPREMGYVIGAILLGLLLQSAVGVGQYFGVDLLGLGEGTVVGDIRRISGTFNWPNTLGAYLGTIIVLGLSIWICKGAGKLGNLVFLISMVGVLPLMMTFSRGSWISTAGGLMVVLFLGLIRGWIDSSIIPKLALLLIPAALLSIIFADSIMARSQEETLDVRFLLNEVAFNMMYAHPALGVGINTFTEVMRAYDDNGIWFGFFEPVHNSFLLIGAEMGLIGLSIFLALILITLWEGFQAIQIENRFLSACSIGFVGGITALAVSNLADVHLRSIDGIYALFWTFAGLIAAVRRMQMSIVVSPGLQTIPGESYEYSRAGLQP
jgi:putative inorganic carbon (HCO3(-)) transporter